VTRRQLVFGFDPGLTTGVALLDPDKPEILAYTELRYTGELWPYVRKAPEWFNDEIDVHMVVEQFTIPQHTSKTPQTWSLRVIGMLEERADAYGWGFKHYMPAAAKRLVTDERLKAIDLYVPGMGHARDALRHAILFSVDDLGYNLIR